ncbi:hypothetical protein GUJ93_ZPchr0010g10047 [Zizania palustris]|uniref:Uncharacterized protein n=1 Tax=Zizania palustris TaxID=103762 RepID=A0A8J5TGP2_ZIZPA|nr:hypothetical protein GUJ93_ZPchr0010g10047 [Zizania palustris]
MFNFSFCLNCPSSSRGYASGSSPTQQQSVAAPAPPSSGKRWSFGKSLWDSAEAAAAAAAAVAKAGAVRRSRGWLRRRGSGRCTPRWSGSRASTSSPSLRPPRQRRMRSWQPLRPPSPSCVSPARVA